jgi:hypothetical protein
VHHDTRVKTCADGREQEIDDLVDEWTPEPLVAPQTPFEEAEMERLPVIVGLVGRESLAVYLS